jgi:Spy/CpxP family protein refolding chaperone
MTFTIKTITTLMLLIAAVTFAAPVAEAHNTGKPHHHHKKHSGHGHHNHSAHTQHKH